VCKSGKNVNGAKITLKRYSVGRSLHSLSANLFVQLCCVVIPARKSFSCEDNEVEKVANYSEKAHGRHSVSVDNMINCTMMSFRFTDSMISSTGCSRFEYLHKRNKTIKLASYSAAMYTSHYVWPAELAAHHRCNLRGYLTVAIPLARVRLETSDALHFQSMSQWYCRALPTLTYSWTRGAASRHTTAPVSHTRLSPYSSHWGVTCYSFPLPLTVGGSVSIWAQVVDQ